jgi:cytochrome c biogenesis protein CcmG, thiol:disulfide interchange protein DsbE
MRKMLKYLFPLLVFLGIAAFLFRGLKMDPHRVPSPLIGKPAPTFLLPQLADPARSLATADLKGQVTLLNVWATWCVSCQAEHAVLMQLAQHQGVRIYGLDYKDNRSDAVAWLQTYGNPYIANAFDADGRAGIDWGVYGTPETFILDRRGIVRYKQIGPISERDAQEVILPWIKTLQAEAR